ncbi:porin [Burkholderia arboris]|uniref:Porin n=1 Tax=Burkholderia arboris TaxID=488730 RepID=A0ABZ3DWX0_9BURK
MNKTLLALATLGTFACVAHAQSSVTMYGIIDEGINVNSNVGGKHLYSMASGVMQGSRFGLRGAEDLGGGLKAIFTLENGFDVNNGKLGQGGLLFGRQAYVGLRSSQFGTITLGRQYDSIADYVGQFEVASQWGGNVSAHPGDLDNFNNTYRNNNTIKFASADYSGLKVGATYSIGGVAGNFSQNQIWSLGAGYNNGPLALGVAYLNARTPSNAGGLFGNSTSTSTAAAVTTPVYSGFVNANSYQVIGAGGAYTLGAATLGVTYSNISFRNLGANGATIYRHGGNASFNNVEANFKYQFTPALLAGAAFDYTDGGDVTLANGTNQKGSKYFQYSMGVDYFLSKLTDVYVLGVYQHASGIGSTGKAAVAAMNTQSASGNCNQLLARIGIRHKF